MPAACLFYGLGDALGLAEGLGLFIPTSVLGLGLTVTPPVRFPVPPEWPLPMMPS